MPAPGSFPTEAGPHPPGPLPTAGPQEAIAPISAWALGPCLGLGPSPEASGYLLAGLDERSHLDAGSVSHSGQEKLLRPLKHIIENLFTLTGKPN